MKSLPGIARRRGRFRHRVGVEMLIRARIVGRMHQRDHRLDRPCFAALVADPGSGLGRLARGRGGLRNGGLRRRRCRRRNFLDCRQRRLDHRPADADFGQRHLPLEAVEPAARRHRQPALATPRRPPSRPDRRKRAWRAPSIRARGPRRRARLPRSPPSAWRRAASAPTGKAQAPRARRQIRAHRARRAPPRARLRAGRAACRRASACAPADRAPSRRSRKLA